MSKEKQEVLLKKKETLRQGGGEKAIEKQHAAGKMTARERLTQLFDEDSFVEIGLFVQHRCTNFGMEKKQAPGEGVVTGYGTVNGRLDNNLVVEFQAPESLIGQWANVHLTGSRAALLVGELVQD